MRVPLLRRSAPSLALALASILIAASVVDAVLVPDRAHGGSSRSRCTAPTSTVDATGPAAQPLVVQRGDGGSPSISMAIYPRPDRPAGSSNPWSQWGQGLVLSDGRFLSAIGDHRGADGNSYLFVYEPRENELVRFSDVWSVVGHQPGSWGYGKVHGQIVKGRCHTAYLATYWGSRTDLRYGDGYRGDVLLELDTSTLELRSLGVPVEEQGIPSLAGSAKRGLVFGEAVDPRASENAGRDTGAFFVFDTELEEVVDRFDDPKHSLFRNVLVDQRGNAYIAGADGALLRYDAATRKLAETGIQLPGGGPLRASTLAAPDGTVYGVTEAEPNRFFALAPDGTVRPLGSARGYTASMALDPDGSRFFYVPSAHGDSFEQDTPVISVDTDTGAQSVVARLNPLAEDQLGLTLNGSYDVAFDKRRNRLFVGLNAGKDREDPWGEVVLAIVDLPDRSP
jgi:hypothetical protein